MMIVAPTATAGSYRSKPKATSVTTIAWLVSVSSGSMTMCTNRFVSFAMMETNSEELVRATISKGFFMKPWKISC